MSVKNAGNSARWLMFAEDPGAAVYLKFLPHVLAFGDIELSVVAASHAKVYFGNNCISLESLECKKPGQILDKFKPDLLIVGTSENPRTFAFDLLDSAKLKGISSVGVVDSASNVSERFKGVGDHPLKHAPDWLIVPDMMTAKAFHNSGFSIEKIFVGGHPRFEEILAWRNTWRASDRSAQRDKWLGVQDDSVQVITFISEISTGLNPHQYSRSSSYTLHGDKDSCGRTEIVLDEFFNFISGLSYKPYLVLRLHPKQNKEELPNHVNKFDFISRAEPALEIVNASDMVIGMTSMLMLEASLLGRRVLSIIPKPEERAWLGPIGEAMLCVWTRSQLQEAFALMQNGKAGYLSDDLLPEMDSKRRIVEFLLAHFSGDVLRSSNTQSSKKQELL